MRKLLAAAALWACLGLVFPTFAGQDEPTAISADGGRYFGPLVNGLREGKGRLEWANGARYDGEFAKGLYSGAGRMRTPNGDIFEGQFKNGLADGKGEVKYSNGRRYRGDFAHGAIEGKGRFEYSNGAVYEGDFVADQFTGKGTATWSNGSRHVGGFKNWSQNGPGKTTDKSGNTYEGNFASTGPIGKATFKSDDGSVYVGTMKDWMPHGHGEMRLANGDVYRGSFEYGQYEGEGTLTYAKPQSDGRREDKGVWHYGRLKAVEEEKERQAQLNAERALYNQPSLLAKQLATLTPSRADTIAMYLLAIGGDGSQEVFRREVDFVTRQFDARFGTRGRSQALVNSRTTVNSVPLATTTSIRQAISAIAAAMNKERDILFLFLTSHGSRDKELVLSLTGVDLPPLRANELATMLKEAGIRWKVIVVSACYSGGFIKDLHDPHTMVITAARADRTSFGCADENDMTSFGRAFFKDALPKAGSFEEAFAEAARRVDEEERRDAEMSVKGQSARSEHRSAKMGAPEPIPEDLVHWWQTVTNYIALFERVFLKETGDAKGKTAQKDKADVDHSLPQIDAPEPIRKHLARWWQEQRPASSRVVKTSAAAK